MKTLARKEWLKLHSYLNNSDHPLDCIIQIALETGARVSEVVNTSATDLDGLNLTIKALKGSNSRVVPISQSLANKINSYTLPLEDIFSAHSDKVSAPNRRRIIDRRLRWVCSHLFIKPVGMHTLRHTICSEIYRETKNIFMVKDFIGHKSLSSTLRYQHHNQKEEAENVVRSLLNAGHD